MKTFSFVKKMSSCSFKILIIQPPTTRHENYQNWRTRHAVHCWRSRDEFVSDVLLWTPSHGRPKAGRAAWTYLQQLRADSGCSPENLPKAIDDRKGWRERVRDIRADSATWWWWWWWWLKEFVFTYPTMFDMP